ncbi:uncharacterized protein RB166_015757 isoform 1-T3 [Leptodactylus fuscus]|uniref:uncharacterized protein LOC142217563 n=1 Tax=Leptodactylus fuscus TaxID=238119 RepID=UPI003F4E8769
MQDSKAKQKVSDCPRSQKSDTVSQSEAGASLEEKISTVLEEIQERQETTEKQGDPRTAEEKPSAVTDQKQGDPRTAEEKPSAVTDQKQSDPETSEEKSSAVTVEKQGDLNTSEEKPSAVTAEKQGNIGTARLKHSAGTTEKHSYLETAEEKLSELTTKKSGEQLTAEGKPSAVAAEKQEDPETSEEKPSAVTEQKQPDPETSEEKPSEVTEQKQPDPETSEEKPSEVNEHKQPDPETSEEKPSVVTEQKQPDPETSEEKPSEVTEQKQPDPETSEEKPSEVTEQKQPDPETSEEKPSEVTEHKEPDPETSEEKPSVVTSETHGDLVILEPPSWMMQFWNICSNIFPRSSNSVPDPHGKDTKRSEIRKITVGEDENDVPAGATAPEITSNEGKLSSIQRILTSTWSTYLLSWVQNKHKVGIFSRSSETDYQWLKTKLESGSFRNVIESVQPCYITNNGYLKFMEDVSRCTFGILYHTKNRGRVNITNVTDSLYDEELEYMFVKLGKTNVIVIIDDLNDDSDHEKERILQNQPNIRDQAQDLFLFTTADHQK